MKMLAKVKMKMKIMKIKLVKDSKSNRVNDLLIHNSIPVTLSDNLLTFRDGGKIFELKVDLLKMITNRNDNVDLASLSDKNHCMILQRKCILIEKLRVINLLEIERL